MLSRRLARKSFIANNDCLKRIARCSVQKIIKGEKLKPFKRIGCSRKSATVKEKRCRHLHDKFSVVDVKRIVFTDENHFTLEIPRIRQNDDVYGDRKKCDITIDRLYHETSRFSKKVMISAGVS